MSPIPQNATGSHWMSSWFWILQRHPWRMSFHRRNRPLRIFVCGEMWLSGFARDPQYSHIALGYTFVIHTFHAYGILQLLQRWCIGLVMIMRSLGILFTTSNLEGWAPGMGANIVGCPMQWAHTRVLILQESGCAAQLAQNCTHMRQFRFLLSLPHPYRKLWPPSTMIAYGKICLWTGMGNGSVTVLQWGLCA
jgi:hypothetical protein